MATYYVDKTTGNDSDTGLTEELAWETIGKVNTEMGTFNPGDFIKFKRDETWTDAILTVDCDGSVGGGYITFRDYGTGIKPIFDCQNTRNNGVFCIQGNSYLKFQNIWIKNSVDDSFVIDQGASDHMWIDGIDITDSAHSGMYLSSINTLTVENVTIDTCLLSGLAIIGSSSNKNTMVKVTDCVAHDCGSDGFTIHHDGGVIDNGSYIWVEDCISYNNGEQGFDVTSGQYIVLKDCESYGNTTSAYLVDDFPAGDDFVWIIGHHSHDEYQGAFFATSQKIIIRHSVIKSSVGSHYLAVQLDCTNLYFVHNVLIDDHEDYAFVIDTGASGLFARNNIFTSSSSTYPYYHLKYDSPETPSTTSSDFDYNQYYRGDNDSGANLFYDVTEGGHNLATRQSTWSEDENAQYGDPLLNANFTLQTGSPCINTGTWLTTITSENGSGTSFVVGDAIFFQSGFGLGTGDEIQLEGKTSSVTVTDVDYGTNTITVDESVAWTQGDGVAFAFNGFAPDKGAYEVITMTEYRVPSTTKVTGMIQTHADLLEQHGISSGLDASRPAAGTDGNYYFSTDAGKWSRDNGTTWDEVAGLSEVYIQGLIDASITTHEGNADAHHSAPTYDGGTDEVVFEI